MWRGPGHVGGAIGYAFGEEEGDCVGDLKMKVGGACFIVDCGF